MSSNFLIPGNVPKPVTKSLNKPNGGRYENRKSPLEKGKSLADWITLHSSGQDLSGTGGKLLRVTENDMKRHCCETDAWTILNGLVYNVSKYLQYHPGGVDQLMRAVGTDSTELFNQFHPWVSWEAMLKNCLVGRFVGDRSSLPKCKPEKMSENNIEKTSTSLANVKIDEKCGVFRFQGSKIRLVEKEPVALNTYLFTFEFVNYSEIGSMPKLPFGCHFILKVMKQNHNSLSVSRPYTPIKLDTVASKPTLQFIIKVYTDGEFTQELNQASLGVELVVLNVKCDFDEKILLGKKSIDILAAGTGITPFITLTRDYFSNLQVLPISLLYFNKTNRDVIWKNQYILQAQSTPHCFKVKFFLTDEENINFPEKLTFSGKLGEEMLKTALEDSFSDCKEERVVLICGPVGFNEKCLIILRSLDFCDDIIIFGA